MQTASTPHDSRPSLALPAPIVRHQNIVSPTPPPTPRPVKLSGGGGGEGQDRHRKGPGTALQRELSLWHILIMKMFVKVCLHY